MRTLLADISMLFSVAQVGELLLGSLLTLKSDQFPPPVPSDVNCHNFISGGNHVDGMLDTEPPKA